MAFWNADNKPQDPAVSTRTQQGQAQQVPPAAASQHTRGDIENRLRAIIASSGRTPAIDSAIQISDLILELAVEERASDIHIEHQGQNLRIRFRTDGTLQDAIILPNSQNLPIIQRLRVLSGFDPEPPTTFRSEEGRFQKVMGQRTIQIRVSSFPTINGEKLVLRVLDRSQLGLSLDQLGMEEDNLATLKKLVNNPFGIFFVTGSTGSGKTTTLYAMLKTVSTPMVNIITLEDPVEYRLENINQSQINPKTGFNWSDGLRTTLRQDPDVIMVGEVRDRETAEISMRTALTGHRIFTTLHTINAPGVVERLFEMGIPPFLIASSMIGSMAQRLVRKLCPKCSQPVQPPSPAAVEEMVRTLDKAEADMIRKIIAEHGTGFRAERGCPECRNTGFSGRTGIFEIMLMNEDLRKQIIAGQPSDVLRRTAVNHGMRTLLTDGIRKACKGETSLSEVLRVTATIV